MPFVKTGQGQSLGVIKVEGSDKEPKQTKPVQQTSPKDK